MVVIRDSGMIAIQPFAFILVYSIVCAILPKNSLVSFFFFSIPFQAAIHGITVVILLIALLLKSRRVNVPQIVFSVIILLDEFIHLLGYSFTVDFKYFFIYAPNVLLFFFVLFDDSLSNNDIYQGIKYYAIGVSVIALAIIFHAIEEYGMAGLFLGSMRIGGDIDLDINAGHQYTVMNANTLAYFSITALSLLLFVREAINDRVFKVIIIIILLLAGVLSTSRTWLVLGAMVGIIYFMTTRQKGKLGFIITTIALFLVAISFTDYSENLVSRFEERFQDEDVISGGGRESLFNAYNTFLRNNPDYIVFGTGTLYYKQVTNIYESTHSGFQQLYLCYGIVGVVLYLICFILFFKRYRKGKKFQLACFMPFFTCLVFDQTIQFLMPYFLMLPFVATMLPLKLKNE
jgi:O-antigen ligase